MKPVDTQEYARRFNEDEALWRDYERRRELRRLVPARSLASEEILDRLGWLEAERACRELRAIGFFPPMSL